MLVSWKIVVECQMEHCKERWSTTNRRITPQEYMEGLYNNGMIELRGGEAICPRCVVEGETVKSVDPEAWLELAMDTLWRVTQHHVCDERHWRMIDAAKERFDNQ